VTCNNCQKLGHYAMCVASQRSNHVSRPHQKSVRPAQQQAGGKKGKKKVTEYKKRKATGHAPLEQRRRAHPV
jgi:hypothetical protein